MSDDRDCKHGLQARKCEYCELERIEKENHSLRAQRDELVEALDELYRWCNNVEIRGEGLHRGPIWFGGPALKGQGRTEEDDERFEAMEKAEQALANARENPDAQS